MDKLNVWSNSIKKNIENQSDDIFKRDYKFFKIDRLERVSERIDKFSDTCSVCQELKAEVEDLSLNTAKSINGSPRERSSFEKRNGKIIKHLKEDHNLVHKDWYASVYSFVGFASGIVIFGIIGILIDIRYFIFSLLIGFTVGIIIGRILGRKKDKQNENEGLIL